MWQLPWTANAGSPDDATDAQVQDGPDDELRRGVLRFATRLISNQLPLIILLTSGSMFVVGGGAASVVQFGAWQFVALLGVSTALSTGTIWYASRKLVFDQLVDVAETVADVHDTQNYAKRLVRQSDDEVGDLVDTLNDLLAQMDERDQYFRGEGDRLEAEVNARTRELRESNRRLESATEEAIEANRVQGQFIANMTHEIRTPMNGVLGMTQLLLNTELTGQQKKFTRTILESADDLLSIINNILDFSKVGAGKLEKVDSRPFSPRECVSKVSELLVSRAELKGLTLTHNCEDDVPQAMLGDGKRLRQVLTNIIGNAIKFTERGSIVVRISLVRLTEDDSTIRFEIVDTGVGIPSHLHEHVFEGFSQADTSTTRQFGGTGLGLAISKHLVELMGGEIGLVSRPGVGSNFWFTVPGELYRTPTAADRDLGGLRALVLATSSEGRDHLRHQLTTCGGQAVSASTLERALALLQETAGSAQAIDVVIVDSQGMDLSEAMTALRSHEAGRSVPIVQTSTVERPKAEIRDAGLDGFLRKPVSQADLHTCLSKVTGRLAVELASQDIADADADAWGAAQIGEVETTGPESQVAGAHILVAEDNPVNREVVLTMLETLGCRVAIASDGLKAVEAVQRERYDLVFLDCQMPKLDGYATARKIRSLEAEGKLAGRPGPDPPRLPVIALTAHTAPSDRYRCRESGMDDYVSKPVALQTLRSSLLDWVAPSTEATRPATGDPPPSRRPAAQPTAPVTPAASAAEPPVESRPTPVTPAPVAEPTPAPEVETLVSEASLGPILELDRLRGGGVLAKVVSLFTVEAPVILTKIRQAVEQEDAAMVAAAAHALKSCSQNVGAEGMATLSRELEAIGRQGSTEGARDRSEKLEALFPRVCAALEARVARQEPAAPVGS